MGHSPVVRGGERVATGGEAQAGLGGQAGEAAFGSIGHDGSLW